MIALEWKIAVVALLLGGLVVRKWVLWRPKHARIRRILSAVLFTLMLSGLAVHFFLQELYGGLLAVGLGAIAAIQVFSDLSRS